MKMKKMMKEMMKKPTKKASPIGTKGKSKVIAKNSTKGKKAVKPDMGNPGKTVWKRFGA